MAKHAKNHQKAPTTEDVNFACNMLSAENDRLLAWVDLLPEPLREFAMQGEWPVNSDGAPR